MTEDEPNATVEFELGSAQFEWNRRKASSNLRKHKVSFEEAATVFLDERAIYLEDVQHSEHEERLIVLGRSSLKRKLSVVHLEKGQRFRIISARPATKQERRDYDREGRARV